MLLGIDFGSSGCKGVLFSPEGTILAKASQEYSVETIGADGCEMDPQVFFDAFCTVVKEIAEQGEIRAIGISSHGETVIPIGRDRQAAGPAASAAVGPTFWRAFATVKVRLGATGTSAAVLAASLSPVAARI